VRLPIHALAAGVFDVRELLNRTGAFGALVLDGMLQETVRLDDRVGLRLLGPGDLLSVPDGPRSLLVVDASCRATVPTRLALLGREVLEAVVRWPPLVAGLHARMGDQVDRTLTQLMICQLPRVEDRVLSVLWLLAESWGHVTPNGTTLPLALTHDALGGLTGAARSTVTLALGELVASGALLRQDGGWLLLRRPPAAGAGALARFESPRPIDSQRSVWSAAAGVDLEPARLNHQLLREKVAWLRDVHQAHVEQLSARAAKVAATRARVVERRRRHGGPVKRRPAPS
jgi:CRP-like cAMP-binding protein